MMAKATAKRINEHFFIIVVCLMINNEVFFVVSTLYTWTYRKGNRKMKKKLQNYVSLSENVYCYRSGQRREEDDYEPIRSGF